MNTEKLGYLLIIVFEATILYFILNSRKIEEEYIFQYQIHSLFLVFTV